MHLFLGSWDWFPPAWQWCWPTAGKWWGNLHTDNNPAPPPVRVFRSHFIKLGREERDAGDPCCQIKLKTGQWGWSHVRRDWASCLQEFRLWEESWQSSAESYSLFSLPSLTSWSADSITACSRYHRRRSLEVESLHCYRPRYPEEVWPWWPAVLCFQYSSTFSSYWEVNTGPHRRLLISGLLILGTGSKWRRTLTIPWLVFYGAGIIISLSTHLHFTSKCWREEKVSPGLGGEIFTS